MLLKKIKTYSPYIILFLFLIANAFFVKHEFIYKKEFILFFLVLVILVCVYQKDTFKKIIHYFIYFDNDKLIKKISGWLSLLAWLFFVSSLFLLNVGLVSFARWVILGFIIFVVIGAVFTFYDLERGNYIIFSKFKVFFCQWCVSIVFYYKCICD